MGCRVALLFLVLDAAGTYTCLYFRRDKNIYALEKGSKEDEA